MLVPLSNEPRDYAWGSTTLIAGLAGREPSGRPEAEVWFGDHPADPAMTPDGRTLDVWIRTEGADHGMPRQLPYLLKLLSAASARRRGGPRLRQRGGTCAWFSLRWSW